MTNPLEFDIVEKVGTILQNNIKDIKPLRDNSRFVFPTFASNPSQLPQLTIELGSPTITKDSAGDYLSEELLENGDKKVYYYRKITYPIHVYAVTSKEDEIEVKELNQTLYLNGQKLNTYWQNLAKQCLYKNLGELKSLFLDFDVQSVVPTFDNNHYSWASDIICEVIARDKWVREYHKGELISEYSLTTNTIN